jgi:hypothetical protein
MLENYGNDDAIISQVSLLTVNELLNNIDLFYKKTLEVENKFEIYQNFNNSDLKKIYNIYFKPSFNL